MSRRNTIVTSALGGVAGAFAMDVVEQAWAARFERGRATNDLDEEVEALAAVVRIIATVVPSLAGERRAQMAARTLHYAFGIAFAGAYVLAVPRARVLASAGGITFGTGLFILSDRMLIPMLKLGRPWARYSRSERLNALASHVAYGVVLESIRARTMARRRP